LKTDQSEPPFGKRVVDEKRAPAEAEALRDAGENLNRKEASPANSAKTDEPGAEQSEAAGLGNGGGLSLE